MTWDVELAAAMEAAARAGELIRREYEAFAVIPDAPASISTHVDKASQELILDFLHARFRSDALCAEESTPALANVPHHGPRVWVVDPIDGTRGFARKTGQFSVMIGLLADRLPVVGVVHEPVQHRFTFATAGGGCWTQTGDAAPTRCAVSSRAVLSECFVAQSWSKSNRDKSPLDAIGTTHFISTYSGGIKLALVARGEADVYPNTYERFFDWDICAGHILVTEAGGRVTDLAGNAITYQAADFSQTRGLLATNGPIHDAVRVRLS